MQRHRSGAAKSVILLFAVLVGLIFMAVAAWSAGARAATVAGVTPGALAVDAKGQASYEIPLAVPPGIAGMAPSLSLIYNSASGNGPLGLGWSLGGLSAVHRCARTLAQDGAVGGINFDANDRFCLDGKRLVAVAGAYGADGTEYRTEIDGLFKVVSHGAAGSGPAWFRVWSKSGQVMDYGATADSLIEAQGRTEAKVWAANKIADSAGNYLTLSYFEDSTTGAHHIERIDYAANDAAGVTAQSAVEFLYEPRPDVIQGYTAGSLGTMDQRIAAVQTSTSGALVRDYRLTYETGAATGRSRLVSVTECDGTGDCLQPTDFSSQPEVPGWQGSQTQNTPFAIRTYDSITPWGRQNGEFFDVNGDGLLDFVQAVRIANAANNSTIYLRKTWINTGNDWVSSSALKAPFDASFYTSTGLASRYGDFVDVNGDGIKDFVVSFSGMLASIIQKTWLNTGSRWVENSAYKPPFFKNSWFGFNYGDYIDINGDGLTDYVEANKWGSFFNQRTWLNTGNGWLESTDYKAPFAIYEVSRQHGDFVDVDGDGLPDFVGAVTAEGTTSQTTWLNTGTGWVESLSHKAPFVTRSYDPVTPEGRQNGDFIDVNGDGLLDFVQAIIADGQTWQTTWLNTGSGWAESLAHKASFVTRSYDSVTPKGRQNGDFVDANGDGMLDFVQATTADGQTSQTTWLNTGSRWVESPNYNAAFVVRTVDSTTPDGRQNGDFIDVDGDGFTDFVQAVTAGGQTEKAIWINGSVIPGQIAAVTDSLGNQTILTYAPLTDPAVYEKGSDTVFPVQDIQAPMYVVSSVSRDDGMGGQAVTRYSYAEAKVDVQGRGFLGFRFMDAIDEQSGIHTTTRYAQDFPFTGQVEFTESYLADPSGATDGTTLSQTVNTLEALALNGGATRLPYVSQSVAESYELNHGPNNLPVTTVTTDSLYDDFGNPTSITVTTAGGGETFVTTTTNNYTNDPVKWHLGRLTRAEVTKTLPDLSSATRVSAFDYDAVTGLLKQEVVEPDLPAFKLVTDYGRDAFGNVTTTTVSGAGIASRTSTTDYSADGRFPVVTTNALGHSETTVFDPRFGAAASLTGPNGLTTGWAFDGFGRKTREDRADGTATLWDYELCAAQCPPGAVYLVRQKTVIAATGALTGAVAIAYHDALNRAFRQETEGFDGTLVYSDTLFNARGEPEKVSRPYFAGTPAAEIQWAATTTDILGRPLTVTAPDGATETSTYDGLTATTSNALTQSRTKVNNALGQLVRSTDNLGGVVTYSYDPFGNLRRTDAGGAVTTMDYDIRGRKTAMDDPDMGAWSYDHNVLGELILQTDAKLQTVAMDYDKLGRMTSRTEAEGTTTWDYDNPLKTAGIGKLDKVTRTQDDYVEEPFYDSLGRPSEALVTYEGASYSSSTTYDEAGRVATLTYPSGFAVEHAYNAFGHLEEVRELGGAGTVYWRAVEVNAEGKVTEEQLGNGLTTLRDFDPETGLIRTIGTFKGLTPLQDLSYDFDQLGNLKFRADGLQSREEAFIYDGLNRLKSATVTDTVLLTQLGQTTYDYDALGNITFKSDVGAYGYNGLDGGPHAVTTAGGKAYAYDANGAMTSTAVAGGGATTRSVGWSSFNKPVHIQAHDRLATSDFVYGPGRNRIKQTTVKSPVITTVTYIGKHYEKHSRGGTPDKLKHYIRAGKTVAVYTRVDDANPASDKTRWLHRDHLGSIDLVTDEAGLVAERLSYDAHGQRRTADWQAASVNLLGQETARGFTGHEHLDAVGLVHMNGRVYDPELGRFLSADPFVQQPDNLQSYNRYSYVNNNPLSFTDPSGFFFKKLFKAIKKVFKAVAKVFKAIVNAVKSVLRSSAGQLVGSIVAGFFGGPIGAAAFSSLVTVANGGSLTDALMAGAITFATAKAFTKIGDFFGNLDPSSSPGVSVARFAAKTVAHGAVGGVSSKLRGGRFGAGFLSAAFANLASPAIKSMPGGDLAQTATAAVAGGLGAELGGGKFKNGATTGAFGYLFNGLWHMLAGIDAHNTLAAYLQFNYPGEWQVNNTLDGLFGVGRPDLVYVGYGGAIAKPIFEIKPVGSEAAGAAQLNGYVSAGGGGGAGFVAGNLDHVFRGQTEIRLIGMRYRSLTYVFRPTEYRGVIAYTREENGIYEPWTDRILRELWESRPRFGPFFGPSGDPYRR